MVGKLLLLKNGLIVVPLENLCIDSNIYNCIIIRECGNENHKKEGYVIGTIRRCSLDNAKEIQGLIIDSNIFWMNK